MLLLKSNQRKSSKSCKKTTSETYTHSSSIQSHLSKHQDHISLNLGAQFSLTYRPNFLPIRKLYIYSALTVTFFVPGSRASLTEVQIRKGTREQSNPRHTSANVNLHVTGYFGIERFIPKNWQGKYLYTIISRKVLHIFRYFFVWSKSRSIRTV